MKKRLLNRLPLKLVVTGCITLALSFSISVANTFFLYTANDRTFENDSNQLLSIAHLNLYLAYAGYILATAGLIAMIISKFANKR